MRGNLLSIIPYRWEFNKKFFFFTTVVFLLSSIKCEEIHKCETSDDCLAYYNCREGVCQHKGIFPMSFLEILMIFFFSSMSVVATTAGIGGGAVYSAILMYIENFSATQAFPISNFAIFFCALSTFYIGIKGKIEDPDRKFVDYDIVVVFVPITLFGTKLGVLFNKIIPNIVLSILLILCLAWSCYRTYYNALKLKKIEEKNSGDLNLERLNHGFSIEDAYIPPNEEEFNRIFQIEEKESIRNQVERKNSSKVPNTINIINTDNNFFAKQINISSINNKGIFYGKDCPVNLNRIKLVVFIELILIVDTLIEGNDKFPSFLGIKRCSTFYWSVYILFGIFCVWYTYYCYKIVKQNEIYDRNSFTSESSVFKITSPKAESKMVKILIVCFLAGVISGMLGVGGGIIMAPLMLELGIHPKTTASTSNFLLIVTSSASTIMFILSNQLIFSFGFIIAIPCTLAAYFGSGYILDYVTRTNKNSFLVYCLLYVMLFSLIILPINGISRALYDMASGENIFMLNNYC